MTPTTQALPAQLLLAAQRAIELCKRGEWEDALPLMRPIVQETENVEKLPQAFLSYYGYALAAIEARYNDGVRLCQRAIELHFYQAENYVNLAKTFLLLDARRRAVEAIRVGLQIDPSHRELLHLRRSLGQRRPRVIRSLPRSHWLNRLLGRLRHSWLGVGA